MAAELDGTWILEIDLTDGSGDPLALLVVGLVGLRGYGRNASRTARKV